jgi:hypothetical protein
MREIHNVSAIAKFDIVKCMSEKERKKNSTVAIGTDHS